MVGRGVLRQCLRDDRVTSVLAIGRSAVNVTHPKLRELRRGDMFDFSVPDADLAGYDACFFCLGVSSIGMSEADYTRLTFDLTMGWARALARVNPAMTFLYVSGAGTGGKAMWARVKGRTEDALLALFPAAYMIRLGILRPMHGEVSKTTWARIALVVFGPVLALAQRVAPSAVITTEELGRAFLRVVSEGARTRVLEMRDLRELAKQSH
jgi:uncharacterized protein YbjT (DUF2867 family)